MEISARAPVRQGAGGVPAAAEKMPSARLVGPYTRPMSTATLEKPTSSQPPTPPLPESLAALTENGGATRTVLRMAWPAIVENALHTLLGVVDTILVARLGTEAIAGVGAGIQWIFLVFSVLFGLSIGSVVLVARAIGAG